MSGATELTDLSTVALSTTSWFPQRTNYGQPALLGNVAGAYSFNSSYGIVSGDTVPRKAALVVTASGDIAGFYGATSQSSGSCAVTGTLTPDSSNFSVFKAAVRIGPYLGSTTCSVRTPTDFAGVAIFNSTSNLMNLFAFTAARDAGVGLVFAGKF
jgi:hypothetical protein